MPEYINSESLRIFLPPMKKSKPTRVQKIKEGAYVLLGDWGGRPWYLLIEPLIYDVYYEQTGDDGTTKIAKERKFIKPGLITDRATVFLYAARAILNRIGLWEVIKDPAAFHDWLPSERRSDTIFRLALAEEARLNAWHPRRAALQRWIMFQALALTFPLRGLFAKRPRPSVWVAARKYVATHPPQNIQPYTTHDADRKGHASRLFSAD